MPPLFIFGVIVATAFFFGGLANKLGLPKITGYIVAGLILNPTITGFIPATVLGQASIVTNIALSFITFAVGGALYYPRVKELGKTILSIAFLEAAFSFIMVALGALLVLPLLVELPANVLSVGLLPFALLLAAVAAPTDATGTLAIVHQYKTKGPVTSTVMAVDALDDVFGIINYSIAVAVARSIVAGQQPVAQSFFLEPVLAIGGGVLIGIVIGVIFNSLSPLVKHGSESILIMMLLGLLTLGFGTAQLCGFDELLSTMVMGAVVVNFNMHRERIFRILERYTDHLVLMFFFTFSSMSLRLVNIGASFICAAVFFLFRATGKYAGTYLGARLSNAALSVRRYAAGGLIPLGGIGVGLVLMMSEYKVFAPMTEFLIGVVIVSTVVHELIGPLLAREALRRAKEIPEAPRRFGSR